MLNKSRITESFEEFYEILTDATKSKQIMDVHTFKKYEPLFRFDASKQDDVRELSDEFFKSIDPYSPLTIVDDRGEEIIKFPPIFFPIKNISPDKKQAVNTYYNMMQSELPREKALGVQQYTKSLLESQIDGSNIDIIKECKETFRECYEEILNVYAKNTTKEVVEVDIMDNDGIDWD